MQISFKKMLNKIQTILVPFIHLSSYRDTHFKKKIGKLTVNKIFW